MQKILEKNIRCFYIYFKYKTDLIFSIIVQILIYFTKN